VIAVLADNGRHRCTHFEEQSRLGGILGLPRCYPLTVYDLIEYVGQGGNADYGPNENPKYLLHVEETRNACARGRHSAHQIVVMPRAQRHFEEGFGLRCR
jgi:hypothetical protein